MFIRILDNSSQNWFWTCQCHSRSPELFQLEVSCSMTIVC